MLENPIYNPTPNTGLKGQNQVADTAKYQVYKALKGGVQLLEKAIRAIISMIVDMIKEVARPGSTRKYG